MDQERNIFEETDVNKEEIEQRIFDISYEKLIELWMEIGTPPERNCMKSYAHILNQYCSQSIHTSIMELLDYEDKILNHPLLLLERILLLMHMPIRETYPMISLTDVMSRLVNIKQKDSEDLLNYLERFKEKWIFLRRKLGKHFLD